MQRSRPTETKASALDLEVGDARKALAWAEEVFTLKDHEGWKAVQERARDILSRTEAQLDDFEKLTFDQRTVLLKERKDFKLFVGIVDDMEADIPKLQERLMNATRARDEYRGKLNASNQ